MLIRYISDVHTEFKEFKLAELPTDKDSILVLAGDIGVLARTKSLLNFLTQCNDRGFKKVLYVLGNHEAYGKDIYTYVAEYKKLLEDNKLENIIVLDDETFDVPEEKIRIVGSTLWTSCKKEDWFVMQAVKKRMQDFYSISAGVKDGLKLWFTPHKMAELNRKATGYISTVMENTPPDWKRVLVCHHGVTYKSLNPRYVGDILNDVFVDDLSELIYKWKLNLCIHGHTHFNVDYTVYDCRVVSNQVGYPGEGVRKQFEDKVVEV